MARSDGQRRALESTHGRIGVAPKATERAHMATSEVGEMATLKPTDRASPEGARTSSEPTDMAAKTAAGSRDEITSDPTSHITETPAVTSPSSTARRRDVRRSG